MLMALSKSTLQWPNLGWVAEYRNNTALTGKTLNLKVQIGTSALFSCLV
jgi:hypothetical protein